MTSPTKALVDLENKFWQSMVDNDADAATKLLNEPALMVSSYGTMKFDHDGYRKMVEKGPMVLTFFELNNVEVHFPHDATAIVTYQVKQTMAPRGQKGGKVQEMNDTSTWIKAGNNWQCVMHTETPAEKKGAAH